MNTMTQDLFRQDAYLTECTATVTAVTGLGIVLDRTVFYPLGGGQAGDAGVLVLADGTRSPLPTPARARTPRASPQPTSCMCRRRGRKPRWLP
jgi:misacylated tRNA(Ala) deacylase